MNSSALYFLAMMCFLFLFSRRATLIHYGITSHTILRHLLFIPHVFCPDFIFRHMPTSKQMQQSKWRKHSFYYSTIRYQHLDSSSLTSLSSSPKGLRFFYMEDERDAEDAMQKLDRHEFGRKGRPLHVEWTKQEHSVRWPESSRTRLI